MKNYDDMSSRELDKVLRKRKWQVAGVITLAIITTLSVIIGTMAIIHWVIL